MTADEVDGQGREAVRRTEQCAGHAGERPDVRSVSMDGEILVSPRGAVVSCALDGSLGELVYRRPKDIGDPLLLGQLDRREPGTATAASDVLCDGRRRRSVAPGPCRCVA